ncbi:MAG: Flp pilus assembly complex ATPase component TadA [Rickettsiales bacterium]|jgi:type II secretory ATPase GspE/PulE/Tfp pilus assembly ATPase PilB-like protein|nr:Flp pilus assembly complex ATPase component TadA [Rickettsiales bacterium]
MAAAGQSYKKDSAASVPPSMAGGDHKKIVDFLFAENNRLLTGFRGRFELPKDTQNLVAYFEGGELVVSRTHRFDGRVLAFVSLIQTEGLPLKEPYYSDLGLLSAIYKENDSRTNAGAAGRSRLDYDNQMQKDFVDIVAKAAAAKVSDIHIEVAGQTTIYFRRDGSMQTALEYSAAWGENFIRAAFASADISSSNYAKNEYQSAQKDGRTPLRGTKDLYLPAGVLGIRMQFNPIAFGSRYVVMRLLYENPSDGIKLEQEFTDYEQRILARLRSFPTGLVVVAGPTSSGKSTTLFQNMTLMLREREYEINLITVEDPAERKIFGAHQMPVVNAASEEARDEKFTEALAAALRSDPDVLMVGEVRTLSAAELTLKGALSGHSVWTTLHANSALAAATRLIDMGVEAFKLKDETMLRGLMSMRLFKKVCPVCREPLAKRPDHPAYARVKDYYGDVGLKQIFVKGRGCEHCGGKGTLGRVKAGEIVLTDAPLLELLTAGDVRGAMLYWLTKKAGRTLKEAASELMLKGEVGADELERWVGLIDQPDVY